MKKQTPIAKFHLPGLFEFYEFYKEFLPLYREHREYFYDWAEIASIYGAPADCIWGGGRIEDGDNNAQEVLALLKEYNISARLTFSNSLLKEEHLSDRKCNQLCALLEQISRHTGQSSKCVEKCVQLENGVIIYSDLLLHYIQKTYPNLCFISSTTKVITDFGELKSELQREEFRYVVPDFRFNKQLDKLNTLSSDEKSKVEFLCNECCFIGCKDRKACYENVSRKNLGEDYPDHICKAPNAKEGYLFSKAMQNPAFIGVEDIINTYLPNGFYNFKIEGRSLGSAIILEFLLYYMIKPEYHLQVRERLYLDSMLNLF